MIVCESRINALPYPFVSKPSETKLIHALDSPCGSHGPSGGPRPPRDRQTPRPAAARTAPLRPGRVMYTASGQFESV